jgi:hypothetical protein
MDGEQQSVAIPTCRERMVSPTLQTLQDPILLLAGLLPNHRSFTAIAEREVCSHRGCQHLRVVVEHVLDPVGERLLLLQLGK